MIPADAQIQVYLPSEGRTISLPIALVGGGGGGGTLSYVTGSYTGLGDGTSNPVTFAGKPAILIIGTAAGTTALDGQYSGDGVNILYTEEGSAIKAAASTLFNSATVDMDLLNNLFHAFSGADINKVSTTYFYFLAYHA